jgi:Spy/CpxP family protein refolding chaperone
MKNKFLFRTLVIGSIIIAFVTVPALQSGAEPAGASESRQSEVPQVDQHLRFLAERLRLTDAQQARIKPILQTMHDAMQKAIQDQSASPDEREKGRISCFLKADKQVREILNDEQKKKLDQLESEAHSEMHGE